MGEGKTISEQVEELEQIEWQKVGRLKRLTEEETTSLIRNIGSTNFKKSIGKNRIAYYEYLGGAVKIDLERREIYYFGELNEDVRSIIRN